MTDGRSCPSPGTGGGRGREEVVVALAALEDVDALVALDPIRDRVAGAVDALAAEEMQVLDVRREDEARRAVNGVVTFVLALDDLVGAAAATTAAAVPPVAVIAAAGSRIDAGDVVALAAAILSKPRRPSM
jgi:hypothetical protein